MRRFALICVALSLLAAGASMGATVWNPAGAGVYPPDVGNWNQATNWNGGSGLPPGPAPGGDPKAVFNVPGAAECHVTDYQSGFQIVQGDNNTGNVLRIKSGGTVDTLSGQWSAIGYNNPAHCIVETGGTFNFGQHAWIGFIAPSVATLDINGGTVTVGEMLGLGWSGGQGFVNVNDGGTLDLYQLHGDGSTSVKNGSRIDITGTGQIVWSGSHSNVFANYVANGLIVANGVMEDVVITETNGATVVTAATVIPDPPLYFTMIGQNGGTLDFGWSEVPGKQFDLVSSENLAVPSDTWAPYDDGVTTYENIPNSGTGSNTLTGVLPVGGPPRFFAVRKEFGAGVVLLDEDFDAATGLPTGWTSGPHPGDSGSTSWEVGIPASVGPAAANSLSNCVATGIAANYGANSDIWLRSPDIDLTGTGIVSNGATLVFEHSRDIEVASDAGSIRILRAGDLVQLGEDLLNPVAGYVGAWEEAEVELPPEALGETVKIEFQFTSDASNDFIANTGFEVPVLLEGETVDALGGHGWQQGRYGLPGESWRDATDLEAGIWHTDLTGGDHFDSIPEGVNTAFVMGKHDFDTGIRQELKVDLEPNTMYDVSFFVGSPYLNTDGSSGIIIPTNRVELLAGGVLIASDAAPTTPASYTSGTSFDYRTLSYTWDVSHTNEVGQPLEIRLINVATGDQDSHNQELDFDDVAVTITPAPGNVGLAGWYIDDVVVKTPIP